MIKILIVDDEPDVAALLADELETAGFPTAEVPDGVSAVLKVLDGGWDLLLMDIRMPKLDGINALRIVRRVAPRLPVIMFTGQAGQGDMAAAAQLGAVACLLKPVKLDELLRTVQMALQRSTAPSR